MTALIILPDSVKLECGNFSAPLMVFDNQPSGVQLRYKMPGFPGTNLGYGETKLLSIEPRT
jgi:hypothetical protein